MLKQTSFVFNKMTLRFIQSNLASGVSKNKRPDEQTRWRTIAINTRKCFIINS